MQSFGERLRQERETRNTTIEEISAATGIHRGFLEALEKNEFESLPGSAFGKFYLRAYAEILDFDPEPLIVHYDRERHRDPPEPSERPPDEPTLRRVEASLAKWRASHGGRKSVGRVVEVVEVVEESDDEPQDVEVAAEELHGGRENVGRVVEVVEEPGDEPRDVEVAVEELHGGRENVGAPTVESEPEVVPAVAELEHAQGVPALEEIKRQPVEGLEGRTRRPSHILAATVGVVGLAIAIYLAVRPASAPSSLPSTPPSVAAAPTTSQPVPQAAVPAPAPAPVKPTAPLPKRAEAPVAASSYSVTDFGVGFRDRAERVETPVEAFHEGDVVAFSTRVQGGTAGQSIRHVWLHRGRAVQSIRLRIGAADWRTYSTKTLWGAGPWSVEARDESGQVLARSTFDCERKPR